MERGICEGAGAARTLTYTGHLLVVDLFSVESLIKQSISGLHLFGQPRHLSHLTIKNPLINLLPRPLKIPVRRYRHIFPPDYTDHISLFRNAYELQA